ncbi:hypothetical protein Hanom_Chr02g00142591 [Helianthus anomalus]
MLLLISNLVHKVLKRVIALIRASPLLQGWSEVDKNALDRYIGQTTLKGCLETSH